MLRLPKYAVHRDNILDDGRRTNGFTATAVKRSVSQHRIDLPMRTHIEDTAFKLHLTLGGVLIV